MNEMENVRVTAITVLIFLEGISFLTSKQKNRPHRKTRLVRQGQLVLSDLAVPSLILI
jgi:hypothetical protein